MHGFTNVGGGGGGRCCGPPKQHTWFQAVVLGLVVKVANVVAVLRQRPMHTRLAWSVLLRANNAAGGAGGNTNINVSGTIWTNRAALVVPTWLTAREHSPNCAPAQTPANTANSPL